MRKYAQRVCATRPALGGVANLSFSTGGYTVYAGRRCSRLAVSHAGGAPACPTLPASGYPSRVARLDAPAGLWHSFSRADWLAHASTRCRADEPACPARKTTAALALVFSTVPADLWRGLCWRLDILLTPGDPSIR